ncbi:alpha-aminoadipate reductase [Aulographum hederae CBS 113979]|uniref:Alpha-aminoadipate reductase n=1 Tax=Aulographum hederae CBS 113979 TaxID=1176131 RepID=A0A6G1HEB7_9PEZI|nr:alpha-aminoadipate reductase [Aulographum hederae CBS 113979]
MALPDPTSELNWSDFKGPVQDFFAANAEKHPDRLCVVETASRSTPKREFTYQTIHHASNIVAQHLVQNGIQRGEVVMIFAHRGVDLVVAIMGALKSGAAFSVLDPQYPPDRQQIYLDVSRPRAMVVIEKATQEAGPLSDQVKEFVSDTLSLRTEIPALKLHDNGTLTGGDVDGKDCLQDQIALKEQMPDVLVGPDTPPTLSFTSGSEGRPKGVFGRHYSLCKYFPWMAETFGLSENDKFTMLSGIAHDPIQRDIFTPLFLGAQLLVPAQEDIQHELLAEWMRDNKATVSHLTPAMGQIMVGGAVARFPSLRNVFFVGDLLIKRDCRRLQELAENTTIINMYGTTETSRAVSYYKIPSKAKEPKFLDALGDVIPAGTGMQDVQLLVVDRENREKQCNVGESGEIYVRAGGLAEGYLGQEELTGTKFVNNWFVDPQKWAKEDEQRVRAQGKPEPWRQFYKGPRDRLYRSGDLGRYMPDGNVEVTGRADNQIKIRGFRIELGEIDSHLSAHPIVRENMTLVRRDKNEEPTLVSYIVPDIKMWYEWLSEKNLSEITKDDTMIGMLKRFRPLRDDVRDHLKKKLPTYAVPTVIVPLIRFPLNPNGKVDKPALPFPEPYELSAAAGRRPSQMAAALTPTEIEISNIWSGLIPNVSSVGPDDSFFDIGGHSIIAQTMLFKVRKQWQDIDIPMTAIFNRPTLRGFAAEVDRARDPIGLRLDTGNEDRLLRDGPPKQDADYSADAADLAKKLPSSFQTAQLDSKQQNTVFLTGATGFLGAYILKDLLARQNPPVKVIALVRAKDAAAGIQRIVDTCEAYGIWQDTWTSRLECVTGDLAKANLGMDKSAWEHVAKEASVVIQNGARVHWVLPYSSLRPSNVISTQTALTLCSTTRPKQFCFISSTSVLDTEAYLTLSRDSLASGGRGVPESDDLSRSRKGLGTGYGQSKWVSEFLVREAGQRGLSGAILRPGYVTGDEKLGTSITDDFLLRMLKGSLQISCRPQIENTINMVPVNHVARLAVAAALHPPTVEKGLGIVQVTSRPQRMTVETFLASLETYGYTCPSTPYEKWTEKLVQYVDSARESGKEEHALLPLFHMVTANLPDESQAPELDDANAVEVLKKDGVQDVEGLGGRGVTEEIVGAYLAFLVAIGFIPAPPATTTGRVLPEVMLSERQREAMGKIGGRGAGN